MIQHIKNILFLVDLISSFINEDPQRTIKALGPVLRETGEAISRQIVEPILAVIPADELIPE